MKITREKACQRLYHRVSTPLAVSIDGREYQALDWSLGGFRVSGWDRWEDELSADSRLDCRFELPFQGFNIAFAVEIAVVRLKEEEQELAVRFIDLDDRQTELLNHFVEQLVRGAMMPVGDTILRIDSPVTPVSTKPDPSPTAELPTQRLPMKLIGMSMFYLCLGTLLLGLISITVYENFLSLKIKTAVTATPVEPLISLVDGRIKRVSAVIDKPVREGEPLIDIESPDLEKRLQQAKHFIELKKIELESQRKHHALAIDTSGHPNTKESRQHGIEVDRIKDEVALAVQQLVTLYEYRDALGVLSPGKGRVVQMFRNTGALVKRGETIGVFERGGDALVHAYVTPSEARQLSLDLTVAVNLLHMNTQWAGTINRIQADKSHLAHQTLRYAPANLSERHVLVEITLLEPTDKANQLTAQRPRSGLPVEVLFPTTRLARSIQRYLLKDALDAEPLTKAQTASWSM